MAITNESLNGFGLASAELRLSKLEGNLGYIDRAKDFAVQNTPELVSFLNGNEKFKIALQLAILKQEKLGKIEYV